MKVTGFLQRSYHFPPDAMPWGEGDGSPRQVYVNWAVPVHGLEAVKRAQWALKPAENPWSPYS